MQSVWQGELALKRWSERSHLLFWLAAQDIWHDRKVSFCVASSLAAVIAPLLLLFGLKHGVVSQLQDELRQDPRNLEVKMLSSGNYDSDWLEKIRAQPEVGFAIGQPRSLNTQADLVAGQRFVESAEILPTKIGDPMLGSQSQNLEAGQTILSSRAANRLGIKIGDSIRLRAIRRLEGVTDFGELNLNVVAILEPASFSRSAAFLAPDRLLELERFRDGYLVASLGATRGKSLKGTSDLYARARLYAHEIDGVAKLERWLNQQNIETSSRLADIENVKAINHLLGLIFGVIAGSALIGCIASLVGAFLANIDRKRRSIALLRLLGFDKSAVAAYVILQAVLLSSAGFIGGLIFYFAGALLFDHLLGGYKATGSFTCQITIWHGLTALLLSLLVAALVALFSSVRAISIQPAESLREL